MTMRNIIQARPAVGGFYRLRATNVKTGKQRIVADWFPNLITDYGLNAAGSQGQHFEWCHVGSGTLAPAVGQTTLASWKASTNTEFALVSGTQGTAPYYLWMQRTFRFAEGAAAGNLTEIGVGYAGTSTDPLFSRAFILDGVGAPTTITVLSNEILDADYQLRVYAPTTDTVQTIVDSGTAVSHTVTLRAAAVTNSDWWPGNRLTNDFAATAAWSGIRTRMYSGAIGAITALPTGQISEHGGANDAYVDASLQNTGSIFLGLSAANDAGGAIRSMVYRTEALGSYQAEFDPPITKTDAIELTLRFGVSWTRTTAL